MKRQLLLSLLFILSILITYSTPYKSVLNNGIAKWSIVVLPNYEENIEWITTSNVELNNNTYLALCLYATYYNGSYNIELIDRYWKDYTPDLSLSICGEYYIRESIDTAKLYIYDKEMNVEHLISDMSLEVGDTFILPGISKEYLRTEKDYAIVDSVYMLNGNKHIELNVKSFSFNNRKLTFIEGVGPNLGIFYFKGGAGSNPSYFCLNCFYNELSFHKELQDRPCINPIVEGLNYSPLNYYKVKHKLNSVEISFSESNARNVQLYSTSGQLIFKSISSSKSTVEIPRDNLLNGVFILKIEDLITKETITQKLIL
jgi:hypothetical protein